MQPFTQRVVAVIRGIPAGRVMTYGQVAAAAGSPRAARQVVRILHSLSEKHGLPWHRVVNKNGEIAIQEEEGSYTQRLLLEEEGVSFGLGGRIDLSEHAHTPEAGDFPPER
ncbi:MGMT family protein [Cohnella thailandensis]|uniref:Methylated-DNA--[protein]-cysteine S-methyltransferase n=1 Tax=Cohnella thailandensis TaxID=557557 RepID=A0A841SUS0_9BACL|nr:methylated-DNA--[protein]-cysteine S-methyltransferase [Cohnella thailandensis]MBB6634346.1 methylated-DNA--[protein]-cysteine S-methyltransferase [Cohnella thailandensis]MBP1972155.1 methylated-DNA-protein-cysteine methyltransferase-like protein [Cohnella thailandensis]